MKSNNDQLPDGFIAQLEEHYPGITKGRIQVWFKPEFSGFPFITAQVT